MYIKQAKNLSRSCNFNGKPMLWVGYQQMKSEGMKIRDLANSPYTLL